MADGLRDALCQAEARIGNAVQEGARSVFVAAQGLSAVDYEQDTVPSPA